MTRTVKGSPRGLKSAAYQSAGNQVERLPRPGGGIAIGLREAIPLSHASSTGLASMFRFLSFFCLLICLSGCRSAGEGTRRINGAVSAKAGDIITDLDPTGARKRNEDISKAAQAFQQSVDRLDVDRINKVIADLSDVAQTLEAKIGQWEQDLNRVIDERMQAAEIQQRSAEIQGLIDTASGTLRELDIPALNSTILEIRYEIQVAGERLEKLEKTLGEKINLEKLQSIIDRTEQTQTEFNGVLAQTADLEQQVDRLIEPLPAALPRLIRTLTLALWLASALLAVLILAILVRIGRSFRGGGSA